MSLDKNILTKAKGETPCQPDNQMYHFKSYLPSIVLTGSQPCHGV